MIRAAIIITTISLFPSASRSDEAAERLANRFCYALQVMAVCESLTVRADTESRIDTQLGEKVRGGLKSPFFEHCMAGIAEVDKKESNPNFCSDAWRRYGCDGTEIPRLLIENPFTVPNAIVCEYRP